MTASQGQFQLFPAMQSQNKPNYSHPRRQRERTIRSPNMSPVLEDAKPSGQTDAVILQIIQDTNTLMAPSQQKPSHPSPSGSPYTGSNSFYGEIEVPNFSQRPQSRSCSSPSPTIKPNRAQSPIATAPYSNSIGRSSPTSTSNSVRSISLPHHISKRTGRSDIESSPYPYHEMRSSPTPSETFEARTIDPVRGKSPSPSSSQSPPPPPIPMKSIFPRYDPTARLSQQQYYPQGRLMNFSNKSSSQLDYKPNTSLSISSNDGKLQSGLNEEVCIASSETLAQLWDVTSGEASRSNIGTFHMRMRRIDHFTYTLGGDSIPFYVLKSNIMNDMELYKTHPYKPNTRIPIVSLNLSETEDNSIDTDVRIPIFPQLAEILAREQSLESSHDMEATNTAVKSVKASETCTFEWKPSQSRYDLFYKALKDPRNSPQATESLSLWTESNETADSLLQASVSSSSATIGPTSYYPTILITAPDRARCGSLVSEPSNEFPLVALDLENMTLSILASNFLSKTSSPHSVDVLVAAILTVAASNKSTKSILARMDIYEPKAEDFPDPYRSLPSSPPPQLTNRTSSPSPHFTKNPIIYQTVQEESKQEATLMHQIHSRGQKPEKTPVKRGLWPWKRFSSGSKTKKDKKKATVEEIDIERYGGFEDDSTQAGDKQSGPKRAVLGFFVWISFLLSWALNNILKFLAWLSCKKA